MNIILERAKADLCRATTKRQREVAAEVGMAWSSLRRILDGKTTAPRLDTLEKLAPKYLTAREQEVLGFKRGGE